jgi:hypothetical protein
MPASAALFGILLGIATPEPVDDPYVAGVYAEAAAGAGVARRRAVAARPSSDEALRFQRLAAAADLWLRFGGVPERALTLELSGSARLRTTIGGRVEGGTATGSPRRPRARGQHIEITFGALAWPRALGHVLGVGGELGYAIDPFLVESKVDVPSYTVHGPLAFARLEVQMPSGALRFVARPFVGAAITGRNLRSGGYRAAAAEFGVSAQLVVRIHGTLHAFADFTERHALLPFGRTGVRDDYERAGTFGLLIRASMNPMDNDRGRTR